MEREELEALLRERERFGGLRHLTPNKGGYQLTLMRRIVEVAFRPILGRYYYIVEMPEPGVLVLRQPRDLLDVSKTAGLLKLPSRGVPEDLVALLDSDEELRPEETPPC